jgi:hypothetical protein
VKRNILKLLSVILSAALILTFMPAPVTAQAVSGISNTTTLADGAYTPSSFTFSGGTGKVKLTCPEISVTGGKAYAQIVFNSIYFTKLKSSGTEYAAAVDKKAGTSTFRIPAALNTTMEVIGTTTAMSVPHDVNYKLKISITEPLLDSATAELDNTTAIANAVYRPDSFKYSGGTGKVKLTCPQITVRGGRAYATIVFSSRYFTKLKTDGRVYSSKVNVAANTSEFVVPFKVNSSYTIIGTTTAMSAAHDIAYSVRAGLSSGSKVITPGGKTTPGDKKNDKIKKARKLRDGTYKIRTEVTGKMFYIYPKSASKHYSILTIKNGRITAVITLDGQGYDYVYMGTKSRADKAPKSSWSKFSAKNGFYSYKIKVSRLDKKLNISGHSRKYNQWFGDRTIIFYSGTAKRVKAGTTATGSKKRKQASRTNKKSTVVSARKSTAAVNNGTKLKDGTYTPDQFSWSGGSGRLTYIKCTRIRVSGGQAYATIVFGSSSYDSLKASGHVYSKSGSGLSTFVIPVRLNANNTIIGRTTAMSQAHWIEYTIYPYVAGAAAGKSGGSAKVSADKITKKAPAITGLKYISAEKIKNAKYFKIFNYEKGIKLIEINVTEGTGLKGKSGTAVSSNGEVEYDEEGNPIARSQHEITEELYKNKVVNYLLVPAGVEVPAGLDKTYVIVRTPAKRTYLASGSALEFIGALGCRSSISLSGIKKRGLTYAGSYTDPQYSMLVRDKTQLCILPSSALPAKLKKPDNIIEWIIWIFTRNGKEKEQAAQKKQLRAVEKSFTALDIPVIIDRSKDEKTRLATAEWVKVYGAVYGCEKTADKIYEEDVKNEK